MCKPNENTSGERRSMENVMFVKISAFVLLVFPLRTSSRVFEAFSKHTEVFSRSAGSQPSYINSLDQRFLAQLVNAFGSIRPGSIYSTPAAVCCLPNVAAA